MVPTILLTGDSGTGKDPEKKEVADAILSVASIDYTLVARQNHGCRNACKGIQC